MAIQSQQRQRAAAEDVVSKKSAQEQRTRVLEKYPDVPHDVELYISGCNNLWNRDGRFSGKSDPYIKVYRRKYPGIEDVVTPTKIKDTDEKEELVYESPKESSPRGSGNSLPQRGSCSPSSGVGRRP